jgi:capsid protein
MAHKFINKLGTESWRNSVKAGLYPNPKFAPGGIGGIRPRYYTLSDTPEGYTPSDRKTTIEFARTLFASSATLHGAVTKKATFATLDAFQPRFRGANAKWGAEIEAWLKERFYPVCNTRGGNYNFANTLFAISINLDVDGECLIALVNSRDGFPLVQVIPSNRIGQRDVMQKTVESGRYKGNVIKDGIILNANNRAIAYRILGDTEDDDYDLPAQSALLLFEPKHPDQIRGISRFGSIIMDALNKADIDHYLQRAVKLYSSQGIQAYTADGSGDQAGVVNPITGEDSVNADGKAFNASLGIAIKPVLGGMYNFLTADTGQKLEAFNFDTPNPNTEEFIQRLERGILYAIDWDYSSLNAKDIGGASVRLVQAQLRNVIRARQNTLNRAARFIVSFAVATGMANELITPNYDDAWYNWTFSRGELLTVDAGNERDANRKDFLLGLTTASEIAASQGHDWTEQRAQQQKEVADLLTRATELVKQFPNLGFNQAISLLQQRSPNESPHPVPAQGSPQAPN